MLDGRESWSLRGRGKERMIGHSSGISSDEAAPGFRCQKHASRIMPLCSCPTERIPSAAGHCRRVWDMRLDASEAPRIRPARHLPVMPLPALSCWLHGLERIGFQSDGYKTCKVWLSCGCMIWQLGVRLASLAQRSHREDGNLLAPGQYN